MAKEWCFSIEQPLGDLETFKETYESSMEQVYNTIYSEEEWVSLVAQYDLDLLGLDKGIFQTKPEWSVIYNYSKDGVDPFTNDREKLEKIDIRNYVSADRTQLQKHMVKVLNSIFSAEIGDPTQPIVELVTLLNTDYKKLNQSEFGTQVDALFESYDFSMSPYTEEGVGISGFRASAMTVTNAIITAASSAIRICPDDIYEHVKRGVVKLFNDAL